MGAEELGRLIQQAREDAGLTQLELAQRIGLKHPQSISRYERGLTEVPAKRLRRIAQETKKDISYFLGVTQDAQTGRAISSAPLELLEAVAVRFDQIADRMEAALGNAQDDLP